MMSILYSHYMNSASLCLMSVPLYLMSVFYMISMSLYMIYVHSFPPLVVLRPLLYDIEPPS